MLSNGATHYYYNSKKKTVRSSRPELFCKKGFIRNFAKITGNYLFQSFFFNKIVGLSPATFLKKRLWYGCSLVNFAKFLRTPFFKEHLRATASGGSFL